MLTLAFALAAALQATPHQDPGQTAGDLQAMYDEITETTLSATSAEDFDNFHAVFFTSDWTFTDRQGVHHTWSELHDAAIHDWLNQPADSMRDVIRRADLRDASAVTDVSSIVIRVVVDADGKYGARGASHRIAESTPMRDHWVLGETGWKVQAREQMGETKLFVDKLPPEMENPKGPIAKQLTRR